MPREARTSKNTKEKKKRKKKEKEEKKKKEKKLALVPVSRKARYTNASVSVSSASRILMKICRVNLIVF